MFARILVAIDDFRQSDPVLDLVKEVAAEDVTEVRALHLRVRECFLKAVDRTTQEVDCFELAQPFRGSPTTEALRQQRFQGLPVHNARGVIAESRIE